GGGGGGGRGGGGCGGGVAGGRGGGGGRGGAGAGPRQFFSRDMAPHRCRSIEMMSSAVMMPARRPCSSTTASVIRLYLSKSAATSSCGVSGAHATYGSLSSNNWAAGEEVAILTRETEPTSL